MSAAVRQAEYETKVEAQLIAALTKAQQYREALQGIANLGAQMALTAKSNTAATGYVYLSGLASDALEET